MARFSLEFVYEKLPSGKNALITNQFYLFVIMVTILCSTKIRVMNLLWLACTLSETQLTKILALLFDLHCMSDISIWYLWQNEYNSEAEVFVSLGSG